MKSAFLIAAPTSGSGKTTIARGLMALLTSKGMKVQPFKCGPDYIDTKFHASVCGRPSINLDTFMASPEHVRELFTAYGADADVCIVEGMMGLFDGYDRDKGSAYEIAKTLDIPVVLVVDASARTSALQALYLIRWDQRATSRCSNRCVMICRSNAWGICRRMLHSNKARAIWVWTSLNNRRLRS